MSLWHSDSRYSNISRVLIGIFDVLDLFWYFYFSFKINSRCQIFASVLTPKLLDSLVVTSQMETLTLNIWNLENDTDEWPLYESQIFRCFSYDLCYFLIKDRKLFFILFIAFKKHLGINYKLHFKFYHFFSLFVVLLCYL